MSGRDILQDDEVDWVFPDLRPGGAGQGGDLTQFTMEGELETFVREVLQNANDAAYSDLDDPVEVDFHIQELTGDELSEFKTALRWEKWKAQVESAADEENSQIARRIERFAEKVEDEDSLRLLTVEDKHTQGLTGPDEDSPDRGSTNFSALVRDSLESNKEEEAAGGKFGLGKAVLRIFSGTSTVLFTSVLSENDPRPDSPRLIGRTKLPQHWKGETRHNGQGFFGDTRTCEGEYEPPASLWGEEAASLADSLHVSRPDHETPGTSVTVVGFRDPSREEPRGTEELAEEIRDEAVKWFWPAIWRGDLRVRAQTSNSTYEGTIDRVPDVEPYIECLESECVKELEETGDVVTESIDISIPDRENGDDPEMTDDGEVGLAVRLTVEDEQRYTNNVALIRGAGMVVRYWDRNKLVHGNRNFHAVTLGGEARAWLEDEDPTSDDTDVENFLKDAEPPAHDDWEQTDATRDDYKRGTKRTIDDLKSDVEEAISDFVGPNFDRGMRGPQRLANRFPLTNQGTTEEPDGAAKIDGDADIRRNNDSEQWSFSATVTPADDDYELVEVEISLPRMAEERQMQDDFVPIGTFDEVPSGCAMSRRENGKVVVFSVDGNQDEIQLAGHSETDPLGVKTRLNVDGTVRPVEVTDDE
ncbi:hypothetical protein I7X12_12455 [Halosimplex litoreum]|uniref:Histidine kinase-, DNA gyrase B-, and HSP90-like ATPase n=1 Tax=Halosimplex litoreum TaxID=1198301 RepID=A0A7T3FVT4_9EURY|nr:hypothetical protein [Halosimplex litoreum]QPV61571.1 hypothetical protein I7X12_12455 [Halosimplex litoreum]